MKAMLLNLSHVSQIWEIEQQAHLTPWNEKIIQDSFGPRSLNYGLFKKSKPIDELLGYCFCQLVAGELSIENICIAPRHQNKGLGKALLTNVIEQAKALKAEDIFLEVRASNTAAIGLYLAHQFKQVGLRKDYYDKPQSNFKEDALMMKLKLV